MDDMRGLLEGQSSGRDGLIIGEAIALAFAYQSQRVIAKPMKRTSRYVNGGSVPKTIGAGRVLCHNHVQHTVDMPCGLNGFRAWTKTKPPKDFVKCPCGWSGLPHYARRDHVKATGGKAATEVEGLDLGQ